MKVSEIIELLGGSKRVQRITGVGKVTVWKWVQNESIPVHHWPKLIGSPLKGREETLSLVDLYYAVVTYGRLRNVYPKPSTKEKYNEPLQRN